MILLGLFDKLLKSLTNDVEDVVDKVVDTVRNEIANKKDNTSVNNTTANYSTTQAPADDSPYANNHNTGDEYFAQLITESEFPGYTIERNVHPSVFDGSAHPKCFPISYLFRLNGEPKLAVFVMQTNQYKAMIAQGSYDILCDNNIHYIRFFKGMKNEKSYVINRIRENLNV